MRDDTARSDGVSRRELLKASAVGVGSLSLAGCSGDDPRSPPALAGSTPELDLETSRAETPAGTVEAERSWENTYVGAVDEDLYVAVSFSERPETEQLQEATAYLCDGEIAEYLTGEVGVETNTLEGEALDVELSFADDVVSGAVIRDGEAPRPFVANESSGDAGLYTAEFTFEGDEYRPYWVVLPNGSRRGQACWRCCGRTCTICCCTTTSCAAPCTSAGLFRLLRGGC
jgi:hypothetical protein